MSGLPSGDSCSVTSTTDNSANVVTHQDPSVLRLHLHLMLLHHQQAILGWTLAHA